MVWPDDVRFMTVQNLQFSIHIRFANNANRHIRRICTRRFCIRRIAFRHTIRDS